MSRNGSGTYSLPEAPFVAGTPVSSAAVNSNNNNIADALTDSLSRSGLGGMQTTLSLATGGFSYSADPDTGMSRSGANTQIITCGGQSWTFTSTEMTSPGGVTFSSLQTLIGEAKIWCLPTAPSGYVFLRGQACTSSYPLWRAALVSASNPFGTSGPDPKFPNFQCRLPAGFDADGLGLLTGSTVLGAEIGQQTRTLVTANLPAYTPSGSVSAPVITVNNGGNQVIGGAGGLNIGGGTSGSTVTITATSSAPTFTGSAQGGTSTPVTTIQPTLILNFIGRAA